MTHNKLPADPAALILGIISLVLGVAGCCCYGVTAIVPLILGIIGLVVANKSLREYQTHPEAFSPISKGNVVTAKVLNIIAIVLNGLVVAIVIVFFILYGTLFSAAVFSGMNNDNYEYYDDDYKIEKEVDSISEDTLELKEDIYEIEIEEN
ncbi:MAG: CCC motif membrane protein [Bacteroidota bacterium]